MEINVLGGSLFSDIAVDCWLLLGDATVQPFISMLKNHRLRGNSMVHHGESLVPEIISTAVSSALTKSEQP
jgi:hypothetical protein